MFKSKLNAVFALTTVGIIACSSNPKVVELSATTDPQVEIQRIDDNIKQARINQVDVLSPKNFKAAKAAWDDAKELRGANKEQKKVLHSLALSQAYLDKANVTAGVGTQILKAPIAARKDALNANTENNFPKEMDLADKDFKKLTSQIENNNTSNAESNSGKIEATYRDLELLSIKKNKLGSAQSNIKEALKEGAKKLTPETLAWAEKRFAEDEAIINTSRHDTIKVDEAGKDATTSSIRLLNLVRVAKNSTAKNPEDFAKLSESNALAITQSEIKLNKANTELAKSQQDLLVTNNKNDKLETQTELDKEFDNASSQFSEDEAEVYKKDHKLVLRLKGLSFDNNKSEIKANNFELLTKVQKVINDVNAGQIEIEGHSDSVGSKKLNLKLSTERAQSVKSYLIANGNLPSELITVTGYGDAKPITINKTTEGRALNRRVDVIITSKSSRQML